MTDDVPRLELCWGTVGLTPVEDLVAAAAGAGFHAVTVASSECADLVADETRLRKLRAQLSAAGVVISTVDPLVNGLPGLRGAQAMPDGYGGLLQSTAADCGHFADALGATTVNVAHVTGQPVPMQQLVDAVAEMATTLSQFGARASIEFIPGTGIPDLQSARTIVEAVGALNLGITFDTWHFRRAGGEPSELADVRPGEILSVQINDARDLHPGGPHVPGAERLLPGDGTLPLHDILTRLLRVQPGLLVGVEVFSDELRSMGPARAAVVAFQAATRVIAGVVAAGPPA